MKTNKRFVAGMAALALTFGLMVACNKKADAQASGGGSGSGGLIKTAQAMEQAWGKYQESKDEKDLDAFRKIRDDFEKAIRATKPEAFADALKSINSAPSWVTTVAMRYASPEMAANLVLTGANPGGDFSYDLNRAKDGIIIKKYTGTNPNLVIPKEIEGYPVVQIGEVDGLGSISRILSTVVIPEGVKIISGWAFNGYNGSENLESVVFPASLTEIQKNAFSSNKGLVNVDLSATSLTVIGKSAFSNCSKLKTVKLPDTVTSIGIDAFSGSRALTDINIPASVKTIGNDAFTSCNELYNLTIPESITAIRFGGAERDFEGCGKLPLRTRQRLKDLGYKGDF